MENIFCNFYCIFEIVTKFCTFWKKDHLHSLNISEVIDHDKCVTSMRVHGGQNRPPFFSKLRARKNGPCNTDSLWLLVSCWETKVLQQNNAIIDIKSVYTKHIHQTNEVQVLSVMINNLREVNRYWVESNSTSLQPHVQCVRLWGAVLDKVKVVFVTMRSHII